MRNPLIKRLPRELRSEIGKYIALFLFLTLTIGFVSGFLVADNSMKISYDESFEKYSIEHGHFILEDEASADLISDVGAEYDITVYELFCKNKETPEGHNVRFFKPREEIDRHNMLQYIQPMDLKKFGLIPELVGRFPVLTHLDPLDRNALLRILTEPKNALVKQYQELFKMDDVKLEFDTAALNQIVDTAVEYKLGARGLRSIMEKVMNDLMFELPSHSGETIRITKKTVQKNL